MLLLPYVRKGGVFHRSTRINTSNRMRIKSNLKRTPTSDECQIKITVSSTTVCGNFQCLLIVIMVSTMISNLSFVDGRAYATHGAVPLETPTSSSLILSGSGNAVDGSHLNSTITTTKQKLSIETNSIQRPVVEANNIAGGAVSDQSRSLKRVFLSNRTVTCNDGSQAGFYLRKSPGSKKWIVFLEGGWHCFDTKSCRARWMKLRHLMTSAQWPETRDVGGILSGLQDENPYWHKANHVLVPYCSSDSWSGTKSQADTRDGWRFMGSLIIRQVIADLIPLGLGRGTGAELLLVGSSAGGLGVMLNLDRINKFLHHERNLKVTVRGVSDSGWFLDREPYTPSAVASSEAVRQGWKMWDGQLPEACVKQHIAEPWRCYFGYRLYPTLKSPLFVFQWLFDEAQMRADNVGAPVTPQQWNYIHEMGGALRSSLDNVTAVFAPSCIGHAVLSKRDWVNIRIDDISLPKALRCWEQSTRRRQHKQRNNNNNNKMRRSTETSVLLTAEKRRNNNRKPNHQRHKHPELDDAGGKPKHNHRLTKEERQQKRQRNQQRKRNKNNNNNRRRMHTTAMPGNRIAENSISTANENGTQSDRNRRKNQNNNNHHERLNRRGGNHLNSNNDNREKNRRRRRRKEQQFQKEQPAAKHHDHQQQLQENRPSANNANSNQVNDSNNKALTTPPPQKCVLRLLERCSWPQCNHSCPTLTNPLTGEDMRFLELLTSFGLDIEAVAAALGVDMQTLNNMDQTELVNMLTQQVN